MRRRNWEPGNVVLVTLPNEKHCYGRVLDLYVIGFYGLQSDEVLPVADVITCEVIFKIWVMRYSISRRHWSVLGRIPLEEALQVRPKFFKQDLITGALTTTYDATEETPAMREECEHLERLAVWDPQHVESRLRDYFAGVPNGFVEQQRPK